MANSRKSPSTDRSIREALTNALVKASCAASPLRVCIAYSGGLDSTVLLDAFSRLIGAEYCGQVVLSAVHMNHGLSENAEAWERHCETQCRLRGVPLLKYQLSLDKAASGIELTARTERYRILAQLEADIVFLAHHQDDQAESVLLNMFRGSGLLGTSGIPERNGQIFRPFLGLPRAVLLDYAVQHSLSWIEDESNASTAFNRNYIRHAVLPAIKSRFPMAGANLANVASSAAEAQQLLEDLAIEDGALVAPLPIVRLLQLQQTKGAARARNLLVCHLRKQGVRLPSRIWLEEVYRQLMFAREDAELCIAVGEKAVRRFQGKLFITDKESAPIPGRKLWNGESDLPWGNGVITAKPVNGSGLDLCLLSGTLEFRPRTGGERMRVGAVRREVKALLREAATPPWQRQGLPLLFHKNEVIWIPGVGIAENYQCSPGKDGITLEFTGPSW